MNGNIFYPFSGLRLYLCKCTLGEDNTECLVRKWRRACPSYHVPEGLGKVKDEDGLWVLISGRQS